MTAINAALRPLFDLLLYPLRELPAIVGVTLFSLVFGAVALWLVKLTSNPAKVDAAKRKVAAGLLEIRLYNDNLGIIFRAVGSILRHQAAYVGHLLVPFVLMVLLFLPFIAQLQFHWGYRGLSEGDTVVFKVAVEEGWDAVLPAAAGEGAPRPEISLEAPAGLRVTSPPVWSPSEREMAWRLEAAASGVHEVGVRAGDASHAKLVGVTDSILRLSPDRRSTGFWNQLLYPAEPPLPDGSGLERIALRYPERDVWFLFWRLHWIIVFLILSIVFALVLRGPMGVTI